MKAGIPPWDRRLEGETAKAWEAFCLYRNLGPSRSIDKAAQKQPQNSPKTAPSGGEDSGGEDARFSATASGAREAPRHWTDWAGRFAWVERVRAYDEHTAAEAERQARAAHLQRIAEHRDRSAKIGEQVSQAARALLAKGLGRLQTLTPEDIEPKLLPSFLRTAAAVAEIALNMEAEALGVTELLREMEDAEEQDSEEDSQKGE